MKLLNILFGKHLFVTNTLTSSVLMATGDLIEQNCPWNHRDGEIDWKRIRKMFGVGFCLGPLQHSFYKFIDGRYPCNSVRSVLKKVLIDQTVASPLFIVGFFVSCGALERKLDTCYIELKSKFLGIYAIDCLVWPPSQFINFLYCSPQYRMLYVNFTTMLYDVFLSYMKHDTEIPAVKHSTKDKSKR